MDEKDETSFQDTFLVPKVVAFTVVLASLAYYGHL